MTEASPIRVNLRILIETAEVRVYPQSTNIRVAGINSCVMAEGAISYEKSQHREGKAGGERKEGFF